MSFSMFTKLLTSNRSVQGSGYNLEGQLDNSRQNYELNVQQLTIKNISAMDKSVYHTIYILKTGEVKGVGHNGFGQLGLGNTENQMTPIDIPIQEVKEVSCGGYHTVYLKRNGTIYVTGYNEYGALGLGHSNMVTTLTQLNLPNVERVVAGGYCTFFIMKDGTVKACGRNQYGQLGLGHTTNVKVPTTLSLKNIKEIYCGGDYTFFKMTDGSLKACGYNGYGQLGLGDYENRNLPTTVNIDQVNKVECSAHHTLFLKYDKTVYGCGHNGDGQLGLGNWEHQPSIVKLPIDNVQNILADGYSSFFLINRKLVKGCGHNRYGELALGDTVNRNKITTLKFSNLWDDDYSDEIVILPPFDKGKKVFVADGYFIGRNKNYCFILDKDLCLRVYEREGMKPYDRTYMYIDKRNIKITKNKSIVLNADNSRKFPIDPMFTVGDLNCTTDGEFYFAINNLVFKYDLYNKTVTEFFKGNTVCTCISNMNFFFEDIVYRRNNTSMKQLSVNGEFLGIENVIDIQFESYTKFIYKDDKGYLTNNDFSVSKVINFEDKITCALFTSGKRLFVGTKGGYVYSFRNLTDVDNKLLYKKYDHEISVLRVKENNNALDKTLLIDDHGSYLIVGFTDGGYIKDPLYLMPEISIKCNDINFIDGKAYYHMNIRLLNESIFYDNMELLVHNKTNDEVVSLTEFNKDKSLTKVVSFNTQSLGIFSYLRLNYLFGNNSLGTVYTEVCNVKNNMMYMYNDELFLNLSNYTTLPCDVVLEMVNANGTKTTLQTISLPNNVNNKFFKFNKFEGIEILNIKLVQGSVEFYLEENVKASSITLDNRIAQINTEGDILSDFNRLFSKIYEEKNLSDISLDDIVKMLNQLSHKKVGKTEILESTKLDNDVKNDVFGNTSNFLADSNSHYLMSFDPENVYKSMRYRSNIFVNGRKVPYNDVYNLLNTGSTQMISYFNDRNIEKLARNYVEGNIYEESLLQGENEVHTIHIRDFETSDRLLKGTYYFTVCNISEYIDVDRMSLYVKFRHGSYTNRITLNHYNLEMTEATDSYYTFKLEVRDQVLSQVGNEIHVTLNDLDKGTSLIFKDVSKNTNKKYKNYFVPLISMNERGSIINYYVEKSEHIEVFVNGYTMIPYVDYKVMNYPLHLQLPSMVVFRHPVKSDVKIEISILKEDYIDCVVKKKDSNEYIISNLDQNLDTTFLPLLYNTYDKFIDNIKVPNLEENGKNVQVYSNNYYDRKYEYIKFYLENNSLVRFLITLLRLKLKSENIKNPNNIGSVTKNNFNPIKTGYNIYEDNSTDGLLFALLEVFDKSLVDNKDVIIDCNDELQIKMDDDVILDSNKRFSLPYIESDIKLDCNFDYNKDKYSNKILR